MVAELPYRQQNPKTSSLIETFANICCDAAGLAESLDDLQSGTNGKMHLVEQKIMRNIQRFIFFFNGNGISTALQEHVVTKVMKRNRSCISMIPGLHENKLWDLKWELKKYSS